MDEDAKRTDELAFGQPRGMIERTANETERVHSNDEKKSKRWEIGRTSHAMFPQMQ